MERRTRTEAGRPQERRRADRRQGQGASLQFRRATDRRLEGTQYDALLARRALDTRVSRQWAQPSTVDLAPTVVDLTEEAPETARCPECSAEVEALWLVRHYVAAHPSWP